MKKNIILITIDCLRADYLNCICYPEKITPNIDNFAEKGALYTQAFSNGGNTSFSFPSILTSSYGLMHSFGSGEGINYNWIFLSKDRPTLAEILREKGYATAAFHSNPFISSFFYYDRGFSHFDDSIVRSTAKTISDNKLSEFIRKSKVVYKNVVEGKKDGYDAELVNTKAYNWLKVNPKKPFFLWLHYMDIHMPYILPNSSVFERLNALNYFQKSMSKNQQKLSQNNYNKLISLYKKGINYVDQQIKNLYEKLSELNVSLDNTYFIITADHGEQFLEHGYLSHSFLYDEVIHVPLIITGPEINPQKINRIVSLIDLLPTIRDLMNIDNSHNFMGNSLAPLLDVDNDNTHNHVISEAMRTYEGKGLTTSYSYRDDTWKYILSFYKDKISKELYHIKNDSKELQNISERNKEVNKEIEKIIIRHIEYERKIQEKTLKESIIWNRIKNSTRQYLKKINSKQLTRDQT